jgi:hypothetical protein
MMSAEIESFIRSFEEGSLPRVEWTHAKHLTVALWYLLQHPRDEATRRIRHGIQSYNLRVGNRTGFHETITLAWIAVITGFLESRDRERPLADLAGELIAVCGEKDYLLRFYSRDRLFSDEARHRWVTPDLEPIEDHSAPEHWSQATAWSPG